MLRLAVLIPFVAVLLRVSAAHLLSLLEEEDQSLAEFWVTTDLA